MITSLTQGSAGREFTTCPPATPIVFIVDGDVSVRESLKSQIRGAGWHAEAFASATAFLALPRIPRPSCLVLDITLPDLNGLDLQKRVASDRKDMPIIFITDCRDVQMTVQAMKAGAVEFLTKPFRSDVLWSAIRDAIDRSRSALERDAQTKVLRDCYAWLSRREREVMARVVAGLLNKQVAAALGISEITVKAHRGRVMRKMHARSLADLVNMAATLRLSSMRDTGSEVDGDDFAAPRIRRQRPRVELRARGANRPQFAFDV